MIRDTVNSNGQGNDSFIISDGGMNGLPTQDHYIMPVSKPNNNN
jgi:hypothetical protein